MLKLRFTRFMPALLSALLFEYQLGTNSFNSAKLKNVNLSNNLIKAKTARLAQSCSVTIHAFVIPAS